MMMSHYVSYLKHLYLISYQYLSYLAMAVYGEVCYLLLKEKIIR